MLTLETIGCWGRERWGLGVEGSGLRRRRRVVG